MTEQDYSTWTRIGIAIMILGALAAWYFDPAPSPYRTCEPFSGCGPIGWSPN